MQKLRKVVNLMMMIITLQIYTADDNFFGAWKLFLIFANYLIYIMQSISYKIGNKLIKNVLVLPFVTNKGFIWYQECN